MESGPPKVIEKIAGVLIPPACREEVLGDLRERYAGTVRYIGEALSVIPCVIWSRIRRTTDPLVLLMEAMGSYLTFVLAAWWLDRSLLLDETGYARLAVYPAIRMITGTLDGAYGKPRAPYLLSWFTLGWYLYLLWWGFTSTQGFILPPRVAATGVVTSELLVFTIRMVFQPMADRPQNATGPAYWQKLEMSPAVASVWRVILIGAALFTALLYIAFRYGNSR